ncbi:hypothetical protein [Cypionkella sp.]|uniref:hypothetical protein n=1 Tax=Cypionkella sp. TaxID=2811411 RepID=UPI002721FF66|nr:hypothetical protein [Cypionkella sp.]MDO8982748.1 hypothetical protein [Cypionkella sp.]MDP2051458.1 hypothetical protein [Cypionkella sp.]
MDLSKMSRSDLTALQGKLLVIGHAGDALARGGLEPLICLTGEASTITVEPILSFGPVADVVLFEVDIDFTVPKAAPKPASEPAQVVMYEGIETTLTAMIADACPVAPEHILGPVTNQEKCQIEALFLKGASTAEISASLRRHPSIVGSHIYYYKKRLAKPLVQAVPAQASTTDATAAVARKTVVALAGQAADQPRIESAEIQKPGGDRGGLQQLRPAEHDPVQSGAVGGQSLATASDEARPAYVGESKRIWDRIKGLGFPKNWDADLDLEMVEAFARGAKADQVALDLDVDTKLLRDRYAALTACIRNDRGHISIDGQERLVRILRDRLKNLRAGEKAA